MLRFKNSAQVFQDIENDGKTIGSVYIDGLYSVQKFVQNHALSNPQTPLEDIRSSLLKLGFFNNPYKLNILSAAALVGNVRICRFLLENMDPSAQNHMAIKMAALSGSSEVLDLFLADDRCDPCATQGEALILAIGANTRFHDALAITLINHQGGAVLNSVERNRHIQIAASVGNDKMIAHLLQNPTVDPTAFPNLTIGWALINSHHHTVYALYHRIIAKGDNPFKGLEPEQVSAVLTVISDRVHQIQITHDVSGDFSCSKPSSTESGERPALPGVITHSILTFAFGQQSTFDPRSRELEEEVVAGISQKLGSLEL